MRSDSTPSLDTESTCVVTAVTWCILEYRVTLPCQTAVPLRPCLQAAITTLAINHSPCIQVSAPILISTHRKGVVPRSAGRLSTSPAKLASLPPCYSTWSRCCNTKLYESLRKFTEVVIGRLSRQQRCSLCCCDLLHEAGDIFGRVADGWFPPSSRQGRPAAFP